MQSANVRYRHASVELMRGIMHTNNNKLKHKFKESFFTNLQVLNKNGVFNLFTRSVRYVSEMKSWI